MNALFWLCSWPSSFCAKTKQLEAPGCTARHPPRGSRTIRNFVALQKKILVTRTREAVQSPMSDARKKTRQEENLYSESISRASKQKEVGNEYFAKKCYTKANMAYSEALTLLESFSTAEATKIRGFLLLLLLLFMESLS